MKNYDFDEDQDESTVPWTSFNEEIKRVVIDQRITMISNYAFFNCTSLSLITIPDTATRIGNGTFHKSTSLETITLPDSVTMIGNKSFEHCTSVTSLALPETSKVFGSRAFYGCLHSVPHRTLHVARSRCATQPFSTPKCNTSHSTLRAKRGTASLNVCCRSRPQSVLLCLNTTRIRCCCAMRRRSLWTRAVCTVVSAPAPLHVRFSSSALRRSRSGSFSTLCLMVRRKVLEDSLCLVWCRVEACST